MTLRVVQPQIDRIEQEIDLMNEGLEPLRSFILPGGGRARRISISREPSSAGPSERGRSVAPCSAQPAGAGLSEPPVGPSVRPRPLLAEGEGGDVLWQPGATRS